MTASDRVRVVGSPVGPVSPVGSYSLDTLDLLPGLYSGVLCACNGKKGGPVCTEFTGFTCRHWVHLLALDPLGTQPQRLNGQDGLMQAIDNTTSTAGAAETHILTRTRRPSFGLWSCWFVLASVALAPLEVVATGRALAAAGH